MSAVLSFDQRSVNIERSGKKGSHYHWAGSDLGTAIGYLCVIMIIELESELTVREIREVTSKC